MAVIETILVAFSMFSALPVPQVTWSEKNLRFALLAFPLVGAAVGGACWLWTLLCRLLRFTALMRGAGLCVLPVLITGGIHLDGYADTCDALASHAPAEKKRAILSDPHLGAFAAIRLGVYFVVSLAVWTGLPEYRGGAVLCAFCLSRCLSALALTVFPIAADSSLARSFAEASDRKMVRTVLLGLTAVLSLALVGLGGWSMVLAAAVVFFRFWRLVRKEFDGLSGDLSGWFLQSAELWMAGALCLTEYLEKVL